jgi:uncharacterized protein
MCIFTRPREELKNCLLFMMIRISELVNKGEGDRVGLSRVHPIYRFFIEPTSLEAVLDLDDAVLWGALALLTKASDKIVSDCALRLVERKLLKCIDVRRRVEGRHPVRPGMMTGDLQEREARIELKIKEVIAAIVEAASARPENQPPILIDEYRRPLYNRFQDSDSPLNKILIRTERGVQDMATLSSVVSSGDSFEINRVYLSRDDSEGLATVDRLLVN